MELKSLDLRRKQLTERLVREQAATDRFLTVYLSDVQALQKTPPALLTDQMGSILKAEPGESLENTSLKRRLEMLQRHIRSVPQRPSFAEQYRILQESKSILDPERE